jgi:hypothetical protein
MIKDRIKLEIEISLDAVPGTFHQAEDFVKFFQQQCDRMPWYKGTVKLIQNSSKPIEKPTKDGYYWAMQRVKFETGYLEYEPIIVWFNFKDNEVWISDGCDFGHGADQYDFFGEISWNAPSPTRELD